MRNRTRSRRGIFQKFLMIIYILAILSLNGFSVVNASGIITDNLIVHFDAANPSSYPGTGTTWTDLVAPTTNGTLVNGVGFENNALIFDGVDDYISLGNTIQPQYLTIDQWLYLDDWNDTSRRPISISNAQGDGFVLLVREGVLLFRVRPVGASTFLDVQYTLPPMTGWHHVGATFDGTRSKIYLNGDLLAESAPITSNPISYLTSNLYIGIESAGSTIDNQAFYYWSGGIAQTRIYSQALSEAQIATNYSATKSGFPIYTLNLNGGTGEEVYSVTTGQALDIPEPTKANQYFDGWYTDVSLTTPFTDTTAGSSDDTLYAKWNDLEVTDLVLDLDASQASPVFSSGVETYWRDYSGNENHTKLTNVIDNSSSGFLTFSGMLQSLARPEVFVPASYTKELWIRRDGSGSSSQILFSSKDDYLWYSSSNSRLYVGRGNEFFIAEDQSNLRNQWMQIVATYDSGSRVQSLYVNGQFVDSGLAPDINTTNDQLLIGAISDSQDNSLNPFNYFTGDIGVVRLYSRVLSSSSIQQHYNVQINQFRPTLQFDSQGGSAATSIVAVVGTSITLPSTTRSGFTLNGWFSQSSNGTLIGLPGSGITMPVEDLTYYAQWTAVPTYSITYNLDGGINAANPSSYTPNDANITLQAPSRTGYTFDGWYEDGGFTTLISTVVTSRAENLTLYAKWSQIVAPPAPPTTPPPVEQNRGVIVTSPITRRPLIETFSLIIESGTLVYEQGEDIILPSARVERTYGYIKQDIETPVEIDSSIDVSVPGTYDVIYTAKIGEITLQESVTITITDTIPPTLVVNTKPEWYVGQEIIHDVFASDLGEAIDVHITTNLRQDQHGVYDVTYRAVDRAGNESSMTMQIEVKRPTQKLTTIRFNTYQQYLILLNSRQMNLNAVQIDVVQTNELLGFIEWQAYEEGMVFEDYSTPVYIRVKDDQGREFIRKVDLTIQT